LVIDLSPRTEDVIWLQKYATLLEAGIKKAKRLATALPSAQEKPFRRPYSKKSESFVKDC